MVDPAADHDDDDVRKWKKHIAEVDKARESWHSRCDKIVKRYLDERGEAEKDARRFNVLWSNVQTMRPALYGRQPVPIVERRFLDRDDAGRVASQLLERAIRYQLEDSGLDGAVRRSVLDYLLSGQGVAWVRYEPTFGQAASVANDGSGESGDDEEEGEDEPEAAEAGGGEYGDAPASERLLSECVKVDFINRKDFYAFPAHARIWSEVEAVGKRVFMTRDQLIERFGGKVGKDVTLDHAPASDDGKSGNAATAATVYEIWCKYGKTVKWLAKSHASLLDEQDDPLGLGGFWPCPPPLLATLGNDSLVPTPDYAEYQDQAAEIDSLTDRISLLQKALKVAGAYDRSAGSLKRLLDEDCENELIPVDNWAMFAEKGGLKGVISFLPIGEIADVLRALLEAREQVKRDLYEIMGIADIIRGQSDPDETLGAQRLKGQYVSLRLKDRQREVARFCRDLIVIMGEIIAEQFSPQTLIATAGALYDEGLVVVDQTQIAQQIAAQMPPAAAAVPGQSPPPLPAPPPQLVQQLVEQQRRQKVTEAIQLLRNDKLRGFRIDIETESTIEADATEEKAGRGEMIAAVSTFLKQAGETAQTHPEAVPMMGKMLLFLLRGYRVGRDLEATIEEFVEQAEKQVKAQAGQPKPNPEEAKAQAQIEVARIEAESERQNAQIAQQSKALDFEVKQAQAQAQAKLQKIAWEMEHDRQAHQQRMSELALSASVKAMAPPAPPNGGPPQ